MQGLVHFTHVTWPAQLVPSLSFWVMIGRSPRRDCLGSSSPIPTRTGPTYQNSTSLWIRGFELPQPTKSNQPPIPLLAHGCTRKLQNKETNHFLLIPGCLSAINHQKLSIPSHPGGSLIKLFFLVFTNQYFEKTS